MKRKYGFYEDSSEENEDGEDIEESEEDRDRRIIESMGYEMPEGLPERFSMHTNKLRNDYETKVIMERERLKRDDLAGAWADARKKMNPWNGK